MVINLSGTQPQGPKNLETLENKTVLGSQNKIGLKSGNTSNRPAGSVAGETYLNTQTMNTEIYNGSSWVGLVSPPSVVTNVVASNEGSNRPYNNGRVSVTFTPGEIPGSSYTVTSNPGGSSSTGTASPISITGLQSGVQYSFSVTASTTFGSSAASQSSNLVTATTVPQSPTITSATLDNAQSLVSFSSGATGGSSITGYTVTSSTGNITSSGASSPITITGLTNGTTYTFTITATNANGTSISSSQSNSVTPIAPFLTNKVHTDIFSAAETFAHPDAIITGPTAGGTLTINSISLGSYDYVKRNTSVTLNNFVSSEWFTDTEDSRSAFVYVNGDLAIPSGQVLKPSKRKLFTCIYVKGNLIVNGEISMTGRGANHSVSGSNITAQDILIKSGTYSGVLNPRVPAAGGGGGAGGVDPDGAWGGSGNGNPGGSGTAGSTGGGGGGAHYTPVQPVSTARGGNGAAGTSFSGGSAGGSAFSGNNSSMNLDAQANGGYGGDSMNYYANGTIPGAGNPTGRSFNSNSTVGSNVVTGTGGILIIIVDGQFSGSGAVTAQGVAGDAISGGSSSGGGSVTILTKLDIGPTPNANSVTASSGSGGAGTARKLIYT
jgi:hypothetical protein